jgi:hypothetical protein
MERIEGMKGFEGIEVMRLVVNCAHKSTFTHIAT